MCDCSICFFEDTHDILAKTCIEAKLAVGLCIPRSYNESCYVESGDCFCDTACLYYRDCCQDVYGKWSLWKHNAGFPE